MDDARARSTSPARDEPDEGRPRLNQPEDLAQATAWVAEHWDSVYRLVYRLTGSRHDAEDLAQETFLKAMHRRESFAAGTNLRAWLMRIATNAFLDASRRRRTAKEGAMPEEDLLGAAQQRPPGQGLENSELGEAIAEALSELADVPRAVFLLRTDQDMSFRQIAEMLGTTEETARWHMMQARRQLMTLLDGKV